MLQAQGRRGLLSSGEIAHAIVAKSTALGGTMTLDDLATYQGEWAEPATRTITATNFRIAAAVAGLGRARNAQHARGLRPQLGGRAKLWLRWDRASLYWHHVGGGEEARICGPLYISMQTPNFTAGAAWHKLLSEAVRGIACGQVNPSAPRRPGHARELLGAGDTIVLSTADSEGNMVAWVNAIPRVRFRHHRARLWLHSA